MRSDSGELPNAENAAHDTTSQFARRSMTALAARILAVGLAFLLQIALARLLGAEGYGEYAFAISWMNILAGLAMLGMDRASLRYSAEYLARLERGLLRGFLTRSTQLVLLGSSTVTIGLILAAVGLRGRLTETLFWSLIVAGCLIPVTALAQMRDATLLGVGRILQGLAGVSLRNGLLLAMLVVVVLLRGRLSSWHAATLQLAASIAALGLSSWFLRAWRTSARLQEFPTFETRDWLSVSVPLMAIVLLALLLNQSGIILTGVLLGTELSGRYAVAVRLCDVALLGYHSVNTVIAPRFAALHATGQHEKLQQMLTLCAWATTGVSAGIGTILVAGGPWILPLFGPEFAAAYPILLVLLSGVLVVAVSGPVVYLLNMTGQQRLCLGTYAAGVVANLSLSLALIPVWGLTGAAIATAASVGGCHLILAYAIRRRYGLASHVTLFFGRGSVTDPKWHRSLLRHRRAA